MRRTSPDIVREPSGQLSRRLLFLGAIMFQLFCPDGPASAQFHALVDEVIVATVATPNSPTQPDGSSVADGARDAVAALNAAGGVLGKIVRLTRYEDDCSAASGANIATRISVEGAAVVIGHICSSSALAAAPIYARNALVMISPGARHAKLSDNRASATIFRLSPRDDRFGRDTADMIRARFQGKRVALIHDKSLEARTLADDLARALQSHAMPAVHRDAYVAGEREYNAVIARLLAARAEIAVIPAQPIEARIIFNRWLDLNPNAVLIASQLQAVPESEALARRAGERFIVMQPADWQSSEQRSEPNQSGIRKRSRAAVEAWAQAVAEAGSTGSARVAEKLAAGTAQTNIGPIRFDRRGDAEIQAFKPYVWRGERWHPLDAKP